jgi:hypothetical protein
MFEAATQAESDEKRAPYETDGFPYERKFADFLFLLRATKEEVIVVHHPQALGDTYEQLVESLNRLGDAGKRLAIIPRNERS